MARRHWLTVVGFGLSGVLLYWALRDTNLEWTLNRLRSADPLLMLLAIAAGLASLPLRALRWRASLSHVEEPPTTPALYHAAAIGAMANNLLPARTGELVAASVCARLSSVGLATAASSLAFTHVVDIAVLIPLGVMGLFLEPPVAGLGESQAVRTVLMIGAGVGLLSIAGCGVLAVWLPQSGMLQSAADRDGVLGWTMRLVQSGVEGLGSLQNARSLASVTGGTLALWVMAGMGWYFGMHALGLEIGIGAAFLTQTVVAVGIALPSSPGFFGAFESAARIVLSLYLADSVAGAEAAVVFHVLVFFLPMIFAGAVSLWLTGVSLTDPGGTGRTET